MNSESLLFLIIAGVIIYVLRQQKMRREAGLPPATPRELLGQAAPNPELEREVIELRKRIEVLERIATDRHDARRLSEEIDALRDK